MAKNKALEDKQLWLQVWDGSRGTLLSLKMPLEQKCPCILFLTN